MVRYLLMLVNISFYQSIISQDLQKVACSDRTYMDQFGWITALYDDYLMVGAPQKNKPPYANSGAAYIFKKQLGKWKQIQKLQGASPKAYDFFGAAVAITGKYAVVGADGEDEKKANDSQIRQGRVYVYKRSNDGTWQKSQILELDKKGNGDYFGSQIAMNEKYIVVGASGRKNTSGPDQGAVYIYELSSDIWKLTYVIDGSEHVEGQTPFVYGEKLSLYGDELVSGDPVGHSARIYKLNNKSKKWMLQMSVSAESLKKLKISTESFASSVSIYKNYLLVSDEGEFDPYEGGKTRPRTDSIMTYVREESGNYMQIDVPNKKRIRDSLKITPKEFRAKAKPVLSLEARKSRKTGSGSVCIFKKNKMGDWVFHQQIFASDRSADAHFGNCIAISDSVIAVGAVGDKLKKEKEYNFYAGAAYIFTLSPSGQWIQSKKIVRPNRDIWEKFGFSISAYQKTIAIGCRFDYYDEDERNLIRYAGAVFIYMIK